MAIIKGTKLGDILVGTRCSDLILGCGGGGILYGDAKASVTEVTVSGADDLLAGGAGNDALYGDGTASSGGAPASRHDWVPCKSTRLVRRRKRLVTRRFG